MLPDWLGKCAKLAKLVEVAVCAGGAAKMSPPRSESKSNFFSWAVLWAWERPSPGDWEQQAGKQKRLIKLCLTGDNEWWKHQSVCYLAQWGLVELQRFQGLDFRGAASAAGWGARHRGLDTCHCSCLVWRNIPTHSRKSSDINVVINIKYYCDLAGYVRGIFQSDQTRRSFHQHRSKTDTWIKRNPRQWAECCRTETYGYAKPITAIKFLAEVTCSTLFLCTTAVPSY